jgi:dihydroorotate dehydrogenase electron transfer subunit
MNICHQSTISADPAPWNATVVRDVTEVVSNTAVNAEYWHLVALCGEIAAGAQPGQFFQLLCPQPLDEKPFLRRPMSLYHADPERGRVEFLYKATGAGTRGLSTLKSGDSLDIVGPLGVGFTIDSSWRNIVLVGRGAGLATLVPIASVARRQGASVTAVFSARHPDLIVSEDVLRNLGASVIAVTDAQSTSDPTTVEEILRELIRGLRCDALFTCGSARLMRVQQALSREFNIPAQAALEEQMACGLGHCYCCVRNFNAESQIVSRRICTEGPVFDLREVML